MINRGEVPEGYKKTKVGIIPEDWEVKRLGEISNKITDGTHDTPKVVEKGVPYITAIHVKDGSIDFDNCYYVSEEEHKVIYERCNPEKNDLLMVNIGSGTATPALVNVDFEFSMKNVALIKPNNKVIDSIFLEQFQLYVKDKLFHQLTSGGAQPFLSLKEIGKLLILVPNKIEQQKIAQILSAWDKAIELKEKLIEEKKKQKKGLMQKLLTGEVRLPGFDGEWEEKSISEVSKVMNGGTPSTEITEYWDGEIPWCTPTDITSSGKEINVTTRYITKEALEKSSITLLPTNSILMCSRATIGPRAINKVPMATNQGFKSFICKENLDFEFFYYLIEIYIPTFIRKASGSTFLEISKRDVENTIVYLPPLQEQKAIAQILSTADKEIELLEKELEQLKLQKKGLMQLLLTGIIRVKS